MNIKSKIIFILISGLFTQVPMFGFHSVKKMLRKNSSDKSLVESLSDAATAIVLASDTSNSAQNENKEVEVDKANKYHALTMHDIILMYGPM